MEPIVCERDFSWLFSSLHSCSWCRAARLLVQSHPSTHRRISASFSSWGLWRLPWQRRNSVPIVTLLPQTAKTPEAPKHKLIATWSGMHLWHSRLPGFQRRRIVRSRLNLAQQCRRRWLSPSLGIETFVLSPERGTPAISCGPRVRISLTLIAWERCHFRNLLQTLSETAIFSLPPSRSFKCTSWTKVLLPLHFSNLTYKPLTTNCLSKLQPTVSLADDACTKLMTSAIHEHVISRAYLQNSSHTVTDSFLSIMRAWKTLLIHKLATLDQVHKIRLETKNWTSLLTTLQQELSMSTTFWSFHSLILQIKNHATPSAG